MRTRAVALQPPRGGAPPRRSFRRFLRHRRRHRRCLCRRRSRGRRRLIRRLRRAALWYPLIRGHAAWVRYGRRWLRGGHLVLRRPKARTILRCRLPSLARGCRPRRWWWWQLRQYRGAHARQKRYHIVAAPDLALLLTDVIVLGVRLD